MLSNPIQAEMCFMGDRAARALSSSIALAMFGRVRGGKLILDRVLPKKPAPWADQFEAPFLLATEADLLNRLRFIHAVGGGSGYALACAANWAGHLANTAMTHFDQACQAASVAETRMLAYTRGRYILRGATMLERLSPIVFSALTPEAA